MKDIYLSRDREFKEKTYPQNCGDVLKILRRIDSDKTGLYEAEFLIYPLKIICRKGDIIRGNVKNALAPIVAGIGFAGKGKYDCTKDKKVYRIWANMLHKSYTYEGKNKIEKGVKYSVVPFFRNFQNFASWYYEQEKNYPKKEKLELNKEILFNVQHSKSKVYSPETCMLIPLHIGKQISCYKKDAGVKLNIYGKYVATIITINGEEKKVVSKSFTTFLEAKKFYADNKYKIWKTNVEKCDFLPEEIKNILLEYDFVWNWTLN